MLIIILQVLTIAILLILILIQLIKRFLYYQPSSLRFQTAENFENIKYKNLKGIYNLANKKNKIIIFFPDFTENYTFYNNKLLHFANIGYDSIVYDYSGFGTSSGLPSQNQLLTDCKNIVISVLENYHLNDIILCGSGLSAFLALYTAIDFKLTKVILFNPVLSVQENFYKIMPKFIFYEFDLLKNCKEFEGKVLSITKNKNKNLDIFDIVYQDTINYDEIQKFIDDY
jgi:hypothetical protein